MSGHKPDSPAAHWTTSRSLLERARRDEDGAWKRLAHVYSPLVVYWCREAGVPRADLDDVVQDVLISVSQRLPEFRHDRPQDTFRGWIRVIAARRVADYFPKNEGRPRATGGTTALHLLQGMADPCASATYFDTDAEESDVAYRVLELIRGDFQPQTWSAFWRTAVEGASAAEAAAALSMSPSAVRMTRSRVVNRLRQELAGLTDFELGGRAR